MQKVSVILDEVLHLLRVHLPYNVHDVLNLQIVSGDDAFLVSILVVLERFLHIVRSDTDVNYFWLPAQSGRSRSALQTNEFRMSEDRTVCDVANVSGMCFFIADVAEKNDGEDEGEGRRSKRGKRLSSDS